MSASTTSVACAVAQPLPVQRCRAGALWHSCNDTNGMTCAAVKGSCCEADGLICFSARRYSVPSTDSTVFWCLCWIRIRKHGPPEVTRPTASQRARRPPGLHSVASLLTGLASRCHLHTQTRHQALPLDLKCMQPAAPAPWTSSTPHWNNHIWGRRTSASVEASKGDKRAAHLLHGRGMARRGGNARLHACGALLPLT